MEQVESNSTTSCDQRQQCDCSNRNNGMNITTEWRPKTWTNFTSVDRNIKTLHFQRSKYWWLIEKMYRFIVFFWGGEGGGAFFVFMFNICFACGYILKNLVTTISFWYFNINTHLLAVVWRLISVCNCLLKLVPSYHFCGEKNNYQWQHREQSCFFLQSQTNILLNSEHLTNDTFKRTRERTKQMQMCKMPEAATNGKVPARKFPGSRLKTFTQHLLTNEQCISGQMLQKPIRNQYR